MLRKPWLTWGAGEEFYSDAIVLSRCEDRVLTLYKNVSWRLFSRPLVEKGVVWFNRNPFCTVRTRFYHDASTHDRFYDPRVVEHDSHWGSCKISAELSDLWLKSAGFVSDSSHSRSLCEKLLSSTWLETKSPTDLVPVSRRRQTTKKTKWAAKACHNHSVWMPSCRELKSKLQLSRSWGTDLHTAVSNRSSACSKATFKRLRLVHMFTLSSNLWKSSRANWMSSRWKVQNWQSFHRRLTFQVKNIGEEKRVRVIRRFVRRKLAKRNSTWKTTDSLVKLHFPACQIVKCIAWTMIPCRCLNWQAARGLSLWRETRLFDVCLSQQQLRPTHLQFLANWLVPSWQEQIPFWACSGKFKRRIRQKPYVNLQRRIKALDRQGTRQTTSPRVVRLQ